MRQATFLMLCSLAFALLASVFAQAPPSGPELKEDRKKAQKELEGKALKLLYSTLAEVQTLKLVENQALFQSVAADLLWAHDEKRARSLFQDAINSLTLVVNASERGRGPENSYWILTQSRFQIIQAIAARDAQFALELLRTSHPVASVGPDPDPELSNQELMMEQAIAVQATENDPKLAFKIAQENLKKGVSFNLLNILRRLQQKDGEAATHLAVAMVRKLQTEDLVTNQEAGFTAIELLRALLQPTRDDADGPNARQANSQMKPLILDDQTIRDLAETVVNAALSASSNQPMGLMQVQALLPELERRVPQRASQLRQRVAEVTSTIDPRAKAWMQYEPLLRNGSTDAILAAATDAPAQMRNNLYQVAVGKLIEAGEIERARQIARDNLSAPERDQILEQINRVAIANAIKQHKIDEAKEIISRVSSREERASELAELAAGALTQGDRKQALELLEEARRLINSSPTNQKEIDAVLQVAGAYALVEPAHTFALIDPLIDQANELLAAAALLDKFGSGGGLFSRGEMRLQPSLLQANGPYRYFKSLRSLARADFERTKVVVDRLQRNEVRLMGRLLIAQCVLSERPGSYMISNQVFFGAGGGGTSIIVSH
jgi:hypothetical protein